MASVVLGMPKILTSCNTLLEFFFKLRILRQIKELKIFLGEDGFKLHNMVADNLFWPFGEKCVDHTIFLMRSDFCHPSPCYAVWNHPHLFGSFVQTMLDLFNSHLISLHRRQARMDKDSDSKHEIGFYTMLEDSNF